MSWNIIGLNKPARRAVVSETAEVHKLALLCLQETKIEEWSRPLVREVGGARLADCTVLPAIGTREGAAIFWDKQIVNVISHHLGSFSITVIVVPRLAGATS